MAVAPPEFPARALVTGASGFIGRALVRRLTGAGTRVVCTSRGARAPVHGETWRQGDVADAAFVDDLVREVTPDAIFHLAAVVSGSRDPSAVLPTFHGNLTSSVNLLQASTSVGCRRIVLIGSGDQPTGTEAPCSPYAASKWSMHGYARMFHDLYGTPVTTARPFMVYGPDQPDASKIVPYVITCLLRGDAPALSSGRRRCDWVYVDDVVDGLLALVASDGVLGELVDLGTGELRTVRDVVETIVRQLGTDVRPAWGAISERPGETEFVADAALTARRCGWEATTSVEEGVTRTVDWYRRHVS